MRYIGRTMLVDGIEFRFEPKCISVQVTPESDVKARWFTFKIGDLEDANAMSYLDRIVRAIGFGAELRANQMRKALGAEPRFDADRVCNTLSPRFEVTDRGIIPWKD